MTDIAGFAYFELEITKDGAVFKPPQRDAILDFTSRGGVTDLFVVSHGWNNDIDEARNLYWILFKNVAGILATGRVAGLVSRRFAVLGILWPSKRFADEDLIPGGAASMGTATAAGGPRLAGATLKTQLTALKGTFDKPDATALEQAMALVDRLEDSPTAQRQFVDLIRSVLPAPRDTVDDASDRFFSKPGDVLLKDLSAPVLCPPSSGGRSGAAGLSGAGAAVGGAAGFGDILSGITAAARRLLNYATYYQMKERAGAVGGGVNTVLWEVQAAPPQLHIHLVGHSFGARVVTAAADGAAAIRPASLTLLQGAFSHNGFAAKFDGTNDGFFRRVVTEHKVAGPIVVTHTAKDTAVGIAYPLASRIAGDNRLALGDAGDMFGALGRNGAVRMGPGEAIAGRLLDQTGSYSFKPGKIHNLLAEKFISGHSDVTNPAVANAVLAAAAVSS